MLIDKIPAGLRSMVVSHYKSKPDIRSVGPRMSSTSGSRVESFTEGADFIIIELNSWGPYR